MTVTYRQAGSEDIPNVTKVNRIALNEVHQRHGFGDQQADLNEPPNPFFHFTLEHEPRGFWVAEDDGEIVGMTISWIRGTFWFLSYLFIMPARQGRGIGRTLLEKALEYGRDTDITNRALITGAFNPVSIGLYTHYGMYPREPLYMMEAEAVNVRSTDAETEQLDDEKLEASQQSLGILAAIDKHVMGHTRDNHHQYMLNSKIAKCYLFRKENRPEAYAYIWCNGHVGPVAVISPSSLSPVMKTSLAVAACQDTSKVSLFVAGSNEQAMSIALECRMRVVMPSILMSSKPFGNWANYLFHSPPLM